MTPIEKLLERQAECKKIHEKEILPLELNLADKRRELKEYFLQELNRYHDEMLKDSNGISIKENDIVKQGKDYFLVKQRHTQILFGDILENPRIICKKIDKQLRIGKKDFEFNSSECTELRFIVNATFGIPENIFSYE